MTMPDGASSLFVAAHGGHLDTTAALLEAGADVDAAVQPGLLTPLRVAVEGNHLDVAAMLLIHDANANTLDSDGTSALIKACFNGNLDMVEMLLQHGADVHLANAGQATPLHMAAASGRYPLCSRLVAAGAALDAAQASGVTAMHIAAHSGARDIVEMLLISGANPEAVDGAGLTPLQVARAAHRDVIVELIEAFKAQQERQKQLEEGGGSRPGTPMSAVQFAAAVRTGELSRSPLSSPILLPAASPAAQLSQVPTPSSGGLDGFQLSQVGTPSTGGLGGFQLAPPPPAPALPAAQVVGVAGGQPQSVLGGQRAISMRQTRQPHAWSGNVGVVQAARARSPLVPVQ